MALSVKKKLPVKINPLPGVGPKSTPGENLVYLDAAYQD